MLNKRMSIIGIVLVLVLSSLFFLFKSKETAYEIYNTNSPSRLQEVHLNVSDLEKFLHFTKK